MTSKTKVVLAVVGTVFVLSAARAANEVDAQTPTTNNDRAPVVAAPDYDAPEVDATDIEITAGDLVDFMGPDAVSEFCNAYDVIGETGYPAFADGYGTQDANSPTAREVYDELASRC